MTPLLPSLPVWIFVIPFLGALAAGLGGWFMPSFARAAALASLSAMTAVAGAALAETCAHGAIHARMGNWPPPLGIAWSLDPLGALMALLVAILALSAIAGSGSASETELSGRRTSFHVCALLLVSGLAGMAATADLFNFFVHLELASLNAYALVGAGGRGAPRAALRYLAVGSLGASLYLLGVGHLYAATGTLHMGDMAARLAAVAGGEGTGRLALAGFVLIAAGLAVKMGLFPLHGWMPEAYARAPVASASLMAPLVTKLAAYAQIRIWFWVFGAGFLRDHRIVTDLFCWAGCAAMIAGGILAARQREIRRLLAYSSVSQMGLVAIGLGLATPLAAGGAAFHLLADGFAKSALFGAAAVAAHRFGVVRMEELPALRGRAPLLAGAFVLAGLSLVGIPPLAGFFGKWYLLLSAIRTGRFAVAAAVAAGTLASVWYVFRLLEPVFFKTDSSSLQPPSPPPSPRPSSLIPQWVCLSLAIGILILGLSARTVIWRWLAPSWPPGF